MMAGKIHRAGVEIMAGTDTPIGLLTPGKSLHRELLLLVEAGLTPLEALKTATLNPARYFGMENELGSIEEGMWADLIMLNSNPLVDSGVYKISRNPMYLALALVLIAFAVYLKSLWSLIIVLLFMAYMTRFQIFPEERAMKKRFGDEYIEYMERVRRWI